MIEHTPDLDSLIDGHLHGLERDRFARAHDLPVRGGPHPELPDTLARPHAAAGPRLPVPRPAR